MPGGVPVATVAIGNAGAVNAGLLAAEMLGMSDLNLRLRLKERREQIRARVIEERDLT
jgi:5-(carboxyamino)imidazole ribonucleotide mutase